LTSDPTGHGKLSASDAWRHRQEKMERWYQDLAAEPVRAVEALAYEYGPHAPFLQSLRGTVLDVGGGAGLASVYVPSDADYVVVDPSSLWSTEEWSHIRASLGPEGPRPRFVTGVAESLPFSDNSFDATLIFWSLNHTADPERCVNEIHRVLKPGGRALFALEDMEPTWSDVARLAMQEAMTQLGRPVRQPLDWKQDGIETATVTARYKLSGRPWPLQDDHARITCRDLHRWIKGRFRTDRRDWVGGFLSYELTRCR
jgi:SAM-dependent methyltransferase